MKRYTYNKEGQLISEEELPEPNTTEIKESILNRPGFAELLEVLEEELPQLKNLKQKIKVKFKF